MLIKITDKSVVDKLENTTQPIPEIYSTYFKEYNKIMQWYHFQTDIDANTSIYKKWKKVSELLDVEPIKHPTHLYRNALWAFNWKDDSNNVLIYYDKRGIKIQINKNFRKTEIKEMLINIGNLLSPNNDLNELLLKRLNFLKNFSDKEQKEGYSGLKNLKIENNTVIFNDNIKDCRYDNKFFYVVGNEGESKVELKENFLKEIKKQAKICNSGGLI